MLKAWRALFSRSLLLTMVRLPFLPTPSLDILARSCFANYGLALALRAISEFNMPLERVLAFIDADCRAHPDWLRNALQALRSSPEGTILGGDVQIWRDCQQTSTAIEAYESVFGYRFKLYIERHGFCGTGNLVVRRADYEKVGPFAGINFAEDIEWGERARSAGLRFRYVPEMIVFHPPRRSLRELYAKWDRHIQHFLNMARDKPGWKVRWIARSLAVLGSPIVDSAKVLTSDRVQGISTRLKAILVLFAIRTHRAGKMLSLLMASKGVV